MPIKYYKATDVEQRILEIVRLLDMGHVDLSRVGCIRSFGSASRNTIARCHTLSRALQEGTGIGPYYVIEVIAESFDKLDDEEKLKTLIHELLHIPKSFGGGFRHHDFVNKREVENMYRKYLYRSV